MDIPSVCKLLSINLKRHFLPHLLLAVLTACFTPLLCSIVSLDELHAAQPLEMLLSLTGTILLTPIFLPEQNENIRDVIRSKRTDYVHICILRVLYSAVALAIIFGGFVLVMHTCESAVTFRHVIGGFASALFLGALGFAAAGITGNVPAGYMVSLVYYTANIGLKDKLGNLYLFSMYAGSFTEKYWLLGASLVLIAVGTAACKFRR